MTLVMFVLVSCATVVWAGGYRIAQELIIEAGRKKFLSPGDNGLTHPSAGP